MPGRAAFCGTTLRGACASPIRRARHRPPCLVAETQHIGAGSCSTTWAGNGTNYADPCAHIAANSEADAGAVPIAKDLDLNCESMLWARAKVAEQRPAIVERAGVTALQSVR